MWRSICVAMVAALMLTACESGPFKKNKKSAGDGGYDDELLLENGLQASMNTRFPDVPLPQGVKEDPERSFVYESHSLQIGRMVYNSKHKMNEVSQFYIQEAPKYNWRLDSVLQADGTQLMFEKPGKKMWVSVKISGIVRGGSLLIINLTPDDSSGGRSTLPPL